MSKTSILCLTCGWEGAQTALVREQYWPEDDYMIPGEMVDVCPQCHSQSWETADEGPEA